jgi:hypothetical protein
LRASNVAVTRTSIPFCFDESASFKSRFWKLIFSVDEAGRINASVNVLVNPAEAGNATTSTMSPFLIGRRQQPAVGASGALRRPFRENMRQRDNTSLPHSHLNNATKPTPKLPPTKSDYEARHSCRFSLRG